MIGLYLDENELISDQTTGQMYLDNEINKH